eukprot:TRINITY_DN22574_c0_g1_i1.p1 TRINITY_DN22574_c0_g1~~TRINITY_DN22574_c0_g1_i1.p1  ORF type:complete len:618 (-),score=55.99 TRINITY_DN22574_c0_g1_i1:35-1723(-)
MVLGLSPFIFSPANAQASLHYRDAFWALLLPVTVGGQVADIWRSYLAQRLFWDIGLHFAFTGPLVKQERNSHNFLADYEAEKQLYSQTGALLSFLWSWRSSKPNLAERMEDLWAEAYSRGFLEASDLHLLRLWLFALQRAGYHFPPVQETTGLEIELNKSLNDSSPGSTWLVSPPKKTNKKMSTARKKNSKNVSTATSVTTTTADKSQCRNTLPWDGFAAGRAIACYPEPWMKSGMGGLFGNQLFHIAGAISISLEKKIPLFIEGWPWKFPWNSNDTIFSCLRSSEVIKKASTAPARCVPYPQTSRYHEVLSEWRVGPEPILQSMRLVMSSLPDNIQRGFAGYPELTDSDLLLYFRAWSTTSAVDERSARIWSQPFAFWKMAVKLFRSQVGPAGRVFIVCNPDVRKAPTNVRVMKELNATMVTAGDSFGKDAWIKDFLWAMTAKHMAYAPSTFGFWASFLSYAHTIHFPIFPTLQGAFEKPSCDLMVPGDNRYVYHDWWRNRTYYTSKGEFKSARGCCDNFNNMCGRGGGPLGPLSTPACPLSKNTTRNAIWLKEWYPEMHR